MTTRIGKVRRSPRIMPEPENHAGEHPTRVLLAEDDTDMRLLLSSILQHGGFDVIQARDGAELLAHLAGGDSPAGGRKVDLVIADLREPVNGLDLLSLLRGRDWVTPVILVVAQGDPAARREAVRFGGTVVMERPFAVDDLLSAVAEWT